MFFLLNFAFFVLFLFLDIFNPFGKFSQKAFYLVDELDNRQVAGLGGLAKNKSKATKACENLE
ncbi:hypothetical protein [Campylobacter hyointestinalis]|uniref:hypothetical protein n=1 Tax=Campylobacter hyointestinalis TaxID=198 RepID=UPI0024121F85|nr:hypothetical protein [Campylobacter hyointestinalis]